MVSLVSTTDSLCHIDSAGQTGAVRRLPFGVCSSWIFRHKHSEEGFRCLIGWAGWRVGSGENGRLLG